MTEMKNADKSAFGYGFANEQAHQEVTGLTKREYFAGMAMQGMISGRALNLSQEEAAIIAHQSLQFADELLKQLES